MEQQINNRIVLKFERMLILHNSIKNKKTGSAEKIAESMHLSTTEVYYLVQQLMELNPSLRYHHADTTYYYSDGFPQHVAISIAVIQGNDPIQKLLEVTSLEPVTYNFLFT